MATHTNSWSDLLHGVLEDVQDALVQPAEERPEHQLTLTGPWEGGQVAGYPVVAMGYVGRGKLLVIRKLSGEGHRWVVMGKGH